MAIKISGNTVIDDSQNITATGSGTFGGEINIGGYNGNSTTTDGVLLGSVGGVYSQLADGNPTGVIFQGMHGNTFTSRITAGGAATFASSVSATVGDFTGNVTSDRTSSSHTCFNGKLNGTQTSEILADGSSTFAGVVTGTADYNTFTASVTLANEGSSFRSAESSAGSASKYHFFGSANGTNFCNIATDGSATFAGGGAVINSYGQIVITRSDSNAYPSLTINSAGTTTNTIDLNGDGSATFAGTITSNGGVSFTGGQLVESVNVTAGTLASASDIDLSTGMVHYFTTQESTQVTPNLMVSGKSVNQIMAVGEAISVVIMLTASASGYMSSLTIDGSPVTPMWSNGIAPSEGGASGIDVYSLQIIKTANSTYTVIANSSNFA